MVLLFVSYPFAKGLLAGLVKDWLEALRYHLCDPVPLQLVEHPGNIYVLPVFRSWCLVTGGT